MLVAALYKFHSIHNKNHTLLPLFTLKCIFVLQRGFSQTDVASTDESYKKTSYANKSCHLKTKMK